MLDRVCQVFRLTCLSDYLQFVYTSANRDQQRVHEDHAREFKTQGLAVLSYDQEILVRGYKYASQCCGSIEKDGILKRRSLVFERSKAMDSSNL